MAVWVVGSGTCNSCSCSHSSGSVIYSCVGVGGSYRDYSRGEDCSLFTRKLPHELPLSGCRYIMTVTS